MTAAGVCARMRREASTSRQTHATLLRIALGAGQRDHLVRASDDLHAFNLMIDRVGKSFEQSRMVAAEVDEAMSDAGLVQRA